MHFYRYLSPAELEFYNLRKSARFVTTKKMSFRVRGHKVTIPLGYVADGVFVSQHDFCTKPAWFCFEYLYASHKYDDRIADRGEIDQFMFNNYSNEITVEDNELHIANVRISGDDIYYESNERGVCTCPEIVRDLRVSDEQLELGRISVGIISLIAICVGYGVSSAIQ